jgi:hypothetical protein
MKLATAYDLDLVGTKLNQVIESAIPNLLFPVISKGTNWVRVNDLLIRNKNNCYYVTKKGIEIANFIQKSWAMAYAVAYCQSDFPACSLLKIYNKKLGKCVEEIDRYNYHLEQARERNDIIKENIISDRLSRTLSEYTFIIDEVSPLIKRQSNV